MAHTFTDENFKKEVLDSKEPVLVDFWAEWCGPCRAVGPIIDELAEEYKGKLKVGKVSVDENGGTASSFQIMSIPSVFVFKNGQPVKHLVGAQPKESYKKAIEEVISS